MGMEGGATIDKVFGPDSYRVTRTGKSKYTGTVVGWRGSGNWVFKTQAYEQLPQLAPQKYRLKALIDM